MIKDYRTFKKAREETVTTPPPEESEQTHTEGVVADPSFPNEPSPYREDTPADYPLKDHPEAPLGAEDGSIIHPANKTQCVPPNDPYARFWSGYISDESDAKKRKPEFLTRKPECRHSANLEELERQDPRP